MCVCIPVRLLIVFGHLSIVHSWILRTVCSDLIWFAQTKQLFADFYLMTADVCLLRFWFFSFVHKFKIAIHFWVNFFQLAHWYKVFHHNFWYDLVQRVDIHMYLFRMHGFEKSITITCVCMDIHVLNWAHSRAMVIHCSCLFVCAYVCYSHFGAWLRQTSMNHHRHHHSRTASLFFTYCTICSWINGNESQSFA